MGEVKMSLKCNFYPSRFSINLDKVLKMVEDECIHSYQIQPPAFSVTKLMNDVCQCAVQLASANSEILSDGANLQKEAVDTDIPFVKPISCMNAIDGNNNATGGLSMLVSSGTILQNSIVARQPELALSKQRLTHDVSDISKGEEQARISIVNEFGSESCPFFNYIQKNLVFQNAFVNISIARIGNDDCCANCSANCLSSPFPCACARATGGEFAYTSEGLIRATFLDECISVNHSPENHKTYCKTTCPFERAKKGSSPDQCKGHLVSKCGCTMHCGNRVVQRGITSNFAGVFHTGRKGLGTTHTR
uniref:Pre-SET domain-containing protein n=1 Tax=Oryza punctata TaxID=4537 RepID=A0A0E0LY38_ORYPU